MTGLPFSGVLSDMSKTSDMRLVIFTLTEAVEKLSDIQTSELTQSNSLPTQCFAVSAICLPSDWRKDEKLHPHVPKAWERDHDSIIPDSTIAEADTLSTVERWASS